MNLLMIKSRPWQIQACSGLYINMRLFKSKRNVRSWVRKVMVLQTYDFYDLVIILACTGEGLHEGMEWILQTMKFMEHMELMEKP